MSLRPKIVKLAKMIGGVPGMLNKIDEDAPEYYALECVVTDEMADIALCAGLRKPRTMQYLADKSGKSLEETTRLAHELANTGGLPCGPTGTTASSAAMSRSSPPAPSSGWWATGSSWPSTPRSARPSTPTQQTV